MDFQTAIQVAACHMLWKPGGRVTEINPLSPPSVYTFENRAAQQQELKYISTLH